MELYVHHKDPSDEGECSAIYLSKDKVIVFPTELGKTHVACLLYCDTEPISEPPTLNLAELAVDKEHRGKGYAKRLISELLHHIGTVYKEIYVQDDSDNRNCLESNIYYKMGFKSMDSTNQFKCLKLK